MLSVPVVLCPLSPLLPPSSPLQIKGTYLVVYGPVKTFLIVLVLVLMGAVSSYLLELHRVLWPLQGLMLGVGWGRGRGQVWGVMGGVYTVGWGHVGLTVGVLCLFHQSTAVLSLPCQQSLVVLFLLPQPTDKTVKPKAHKPVEALSVLFVLAHLWMGYFTALYTRDH